MSDELKLREGINHTLDVMFAGKLQEAYSQESIKICVSNVLEQCKQISRQRKYLLGHPTIQSAIGRNFEILGWQVKYEVPFADFDSNYRFDIVAQKGENAIVVEVKPEVTKQDIGQIFAYVLDVKKKIPHGRVFLGIDILNLYNVFEQGEVRDMIMDISNRYGLGIILADTQNAWILPAEFI